MLACRCNDVASAERALKEDPFQRVRIALEPQVILCRCENDPLRRARLDLGYMHEIAGPDAGIGALQPIEPKNVKPFIFLIGPDHAGRRRPLPRDLDHVALGQMKFRHYRQRNARKPASCVFGSRIRYLNSAFRAFLFGHCHPHSCHCVTR